jgi:hypothetical protein
MIWTSFLNFTEPLNIHKILFWVVGYNNILDLLQSLSIQSQFTVFNEYCDYFLFPNEQLWWWKVVGSFGEAWEKD